MKRTGLLTAVFCVMLAATAAMAWDQLDPVEYPAEVQDGSAIIYGGGKIWGIFPDPSDSLWSYFECYDPNAPGGPDWEYLSQEFFIANSAITYQWQYGGEVLVVGNELGEEGESYIYCYDVADSSWDEEEIGEFDLGPGASVALGCPRSHGHSDCGV